MGLWLSKLCTVGGVWDEAGTAVRFVFPKYAALQTPFFFLVGMGAGGGAEGGGEAAGGAGEGTPPVDLEHHKQDSFGGAAAAAGGS